MKRQKIAVIIPVWNEKEGIGHFLRHIQSLNFDEYIVVDGSSTDGTYEYIQKEFPFIRCFQTSIAERASQMNVGASHATSDILLFVHADMQLPRQAVHFIRKQLIDDYIAGGFYKKYHQGHFLLNIYLKFLNVFYLGILKGLVGTNAIFVKRHIFKELKGFAHVPFLEDVMFSDALNKKGKITIIKEPVIVSARKYLKTGTMKQIIRNVRIMVGYKVFKEKPVRLRELYRRS